MANPHKILIIRYSSLGDLVLTSTPILNLRCKYPESELYLTTKSQYEELIKLFPELDGYILYPEPDTFKSAISYLNRIRRKQFDLIIDLHNSLRSRWVRLLSGVSEISIYNNERSRRMSYLKPGAKPPPYIHTVEMYNKALELPSNDTISLTPALNKPKYFENAPQSITIAASAKHDTKKWPVNYFIDLAYRFSRKYDYPVIILADPEDEPVFEKIESDDIRLQIQPNLEDLLKIIVSSTVVITGDTGPMHIAEGFGIPVVAIFGPTHPCLGFYPTGDQSKLVSIYAECSPCSLHGQKACYQQRRFCMEDIKPELIEEIVEHILESN